MEIVFNSIVALFILLYMFFAMQLGASNTEGDIFGAGGFPLVIAVLGIVVLIVITRDILKNKKKIDIPMFNLKTAGGKAVTLNVMAVSLYVVLLNFVGFIIATPIFLITSAKSMGYKEHRALAIYTILVSAVLVFVFGKIFFIPLPRGISVFRDLSYLIY
ncbi:tripartite tricarboxylate transporter TctB family protein [Fusibacter ferrireducens]|uniref:Tripartite tricarboxylate transporter TctB family protein n=1 Tax=Fusibacter ferrireducens TaxID=2785058 RepID=A0ABR9ZQ66_9FIRM|nr:tripartite tricarboxylate transporter TctB family protein [Fusibacter ferrireducens]MBF4692559.1 tripartite tricarboxylate transporter TctB family protein [Fusibacter ferrireducens]